MGEEDPEAVLSDPQVSPETGLVRWTVRVPSPGRRWVWAEVASPGGLWARDVASVHVSDGSALVEVAPEPVAPGAAVRVTGSGFFAERPEDNLVFVGARPAEVLSASSEVLVFRVPEDAVSGPLRVVGAGGQEALWPELGVADVCPPRAPTEEELEAGFLEGRAIVRFREGALDAAGRALLAEEHGAAVQSLGTGEYRLCREGADTLPWLEGLAEDLSDGVLFVVPEMLARPRQAGWERATPNGSTGEPGYGLQDQNILANVALAHATHFPSAGEGAVVALIDTSFPDEGGWRAHLNIVSESDRLLRLLGDPLDHGVKVASVVGETRNGELGMGVAPRVGLRLHEVGTLPGIAWEVARACSHAHVVNMSFGLRSAPDDVFRPFKKRWSQFMRSSCRLAAARAGREPLLVAAADNNRDLQASSMQYPQALPGFLDVVGAYGYPQSESVGAHGGEPERRIYASAWAPMEPGGRPPDIEWPAIGAVTRRSSMQEDPPPLAVAPVGTVRNSRLASVPVSGTSFSTPFVGGFAALIQGERMARGQEPLGRADLRDTLRNRYVLPLGPESCGADDTQCEDLLATEEPNPLSGYGLVHFPDLFVATPTRLGYMGMNGRIKRLGDEQPEEWSALKVLPDGSMWAVARGPSRWPAERDGRLFRITFDERTGAQLPPEDLTGAAPLREPVAVDVDGEGKVYVLDLYGAPYPEADPGPAWMTAQVYEADGRTPLFPPVRPLAGIPLEMRIHFLQNEPYRESWRRYLRVAKDGAPVLYVFGPDGDLQSHPLPFPSPLLLDYWYDEYVPTFVDLAVTPDGEVYLLYRGHNVLLWHAPGSPLWEQLEYLTDGGAIYRCRPGGEDPVRVFPMVGDGQGRVALLLWEQMSRSVAGDFYVASRSFQRERNEPWTELRITRHLPDRPTQLLIEEADVLRLMALDVSAEEDVLALLWVAPQAENEPAVQLRVFNQHVWHPPSMLAVHDEAVVEREDIVAVDFLRP